MSFPEIDPISLLMEQGVIAAPLLQAAHVRARAHGETLNAALVQIGACTEVQMARAVAQAYGMRFEDLDGFRSPPELVVLVPEDLAQTHLMVPLRMQGNRMVVAVADRPSPTVHAALTEAAGLPVEYVVSARTQIWAILKTRDVSDFDEVLAGRAVAAADQPAMGQEQSTIRVLDRFITDAVRAGATDIHLRPDADGVHVRFRLDGKLRPTALLPLAEGLELVSCLKLMAGLDLSEAREMQEGSAGVTVDERDCGLRVSTLPGLHGDAVFVRVVSHQVSTRNLNTLGLRAEHERRLRALLQAQQGILLVTGFPGSGKSSTLYALLSAVNSGQRNIISVEDPVEVRLSGIAQVGVDEASGATFPKLLTAMMSEGVDVIGISDLRDEESVRLAVTAAEQGGLVIGAIHAPSATAGLLRFVRMSSSVPGAAAQVNAVIAQQLLGRVCEHCAVADDPDATVRQRLEQRFGSLSGASFLRGAGCPVCDNSGIIGTVPVYELLLVDEDLRRLVVAGTSEEEVRAQAVRAGFRSLEQDAFARAVQGLLPVDEVMRVRGAASTPAPIVRPTASSASRAAVVSGSQGAGDMTRGEQTIRPATPGSRTRAAAEPVLRVRQQPANVGLLASLHQRGWLAPVGWGVGLAMAAGLLLFAINNPIRFQPAGSTSPKLATVRRPDAATLGSGGNRATSEGTVASTAPPGVDSGSLPGRGPQGPGSGDSQRAVSGTDPRATPGSTGGQQTGTASDVGIGRSIAATGAAQPGNSGQYRAATSPQGRRPAAQPGAVFGIQGDSPPSGATPGDPAAMTPGGNASPVGVPPAGSVPGGKRIVQSVPPSGFSVSILPSGEVNALASGGALRGGGRQGAAAGRRRKTPQGGVGRPGSPGYAGPGYAGAVNAELQAELAASRERERALRQTLAEQRALAGAYRRLEAQIAEVRRNSGSGTVPANQPLNQFGATVPTTVCAGGGGSGGSTAPPSAPGADVPQSGNPGGGGSLDAQIRAQVVIGSHGDFYFFERVPISLTIQNVGKSTATIRFQPGERYDFEILRGNERVWSWMESRGVTPASTPLVLRPKQKQVYRATWDQRDADGEQVRPGWYTLRVTISAMDQWQKKSGQPARMSISSRFQIVGPR